MDGGELLARVSSLVPDGGVPHELEPPDEDSVIRVLLRQQVMTSPAAVHSLAHGDWLPKHLLIDDGTIVGVIDWEFEVLGWRNPAPPQRLRRCMDVIARYAGS